MVCLKDHWHLGLASGHWPIFPGPWPTGTLAWFLGAHAHLLIGTGLASFAWPHLLISSSAPWRWPNLLIGSLALASLAHLLIGSLAQASFLAFLKLFCYGLRLLGSLALIAPFAHLLICSLAHLGLFGSSAQWLIGSLAHLCLFWHLSSSFGSGLIFGISRAFLLRPQDIRVSGLFNLKLLDSSPLNPAIGV